MGLIHPIEMRAVSGRMLKAACRKLAIKRMAVVIDYLSL